MSMAADIVPPSVILAYVVLSIIFRWRPVIPLVAAFFLFAVTGVTFALGGQVVADHFGFAVFYLLVAGSILLVVEHFRERKQER